MIISLGRGLEQNNRSKEKGENTEALKERTLHVPSTWKMMTIINTTVRTINLTQNGKYHTYPAIIPRAART
jgi:hypothetical protein